MSRQTTAKGRLVTLPADDVLRAAELAHWEAEGYRVVPHHPGARFVCLLEPLAPAVIASGGMCAPLEPGLDTLARLVDRHRVDHPALPVMPALERLVERLEGPELPLPPYDWASDDG